MKTHKIVFEISKEDFQHALKRKPKNQQELDNFTHYIDNGIEAQLDWNTLYECASEEIKNEAN